MAFLKRSKSTKTPELKDLFTRPQDPMEGKEGRKRAGTDSRAKREAKERPQAPDRAWTEGRLTSHPAPQQLQPSPVQMQHEEDDEAAWREKRKSKLERRRSFLSRSQSASAASRRKTVERPSLPNDASMLNKVGPRPRQSMHNLRQPSPLLGPGPIEMIDFQSGGDTFSFPTPSPRLPPQNLGSKENAPSPLAGGGPVGAESSPRIGVALGSPPQSPPAWGRSWTADNISGRMPQQKQQLPRLREPNMTAVPEYAPERATTQPELRRKKSGWKTFGALFSRKPSQPLAQETFFKVQMDPPGPMKRHEAQVPIPNRALDSPSPSPYGFQSPDTISSQHKRTPSINRGLARFEARAKIDSQLARSPSALAPVPFGTFDRRPLDPVRDSKDLSRTLQDDTRNDSPMSQHKQSIRDSAGNRMNRVPGATPRTPRLDVEVPGAEMERYSVMFEKLLEPRQSILECRQSKAQACRQKSLMRKDLPATPEIGTPDTSETPSSANTTTLPTEASVPREGRAIASMTVTAVSGQARAVQIVSGSRTPARLNSEPLDAKTVVPQRSMTSPHLGRVPSLTIRVASIKPNGASRPTTKQQQDKEPTSAATAMYRPRTIQRSKTAPAGSVSPIAPVFSRSKVPAFAAANAPEAEDSEVRPSSPLFGENSLPPTPPTTTTVGGTEVGSLAMISGYTGRDALPLDEPAWDMGTSKTISTPPSQRDGRTLRPRVKSPEELERQIVQVSVARQVSVSKARREVKEAMERKGGGVKTLKPRVIEMGQVSHGGFEAGGFEASGKGLGLGFSPAVANVAYAASRKSVYGVVIEDGGSAESLPDMPR